jgi:hypothetical protein
MAEYKPIEDTSSDTVTKQADSAAEEGQAEIELPAVESTSISPAIETAEPIAPAPEIVTPPRTSLHLSSFARDTSAAPCSLPRRRSRRPSVPWSAQQQPAPSQARGGQRHRRRRE